MSADDFVGIRMTENLDQDLLSVVQTAPANFINEDLGFGHGFNSYRRYFDHRGSVRAIGGFRRTLFERLVSQGRQNLP